MSDYSELEMLAGKATPGPWKYWGEVAHEIYGAPSGNSMTRAFKLNQDARFEDAEFVAAANPEVVLSLISEIKQIKAELECARGDLKTAGQVIERYKKDAERYRHIREHSYVEVRCDSPRKIGWKPELLDICVDSAIEKERT